MTEIEVGRQTAEVGDTRRQAAIRGQDYPFSVL